MSLVLAAIKSARAFLRDLNGITWTDSVLMPFIQQAHGEMIQELELNSIGVVKRTSAILLVHAGDTSLINQPTDIIDPVSMLERRVDGSKDDFFDMQRVEYIPEDDPREVLNFWAWIGEQILFTGCTQDREVILHYNGMVNTPERVTDQLGFIFAERYIGARCAALCLDSIDRDSSKIQATADAALYKLIQTNIVGNQFPVRRRAYRSPKFFRRQGFVVNNVVVSAEQAAEEGDFEDVTFYAPSNSPNGSSTTFNFSKMPKFIIYNGLMLFSGFGYNVAVVGSNFVVTIKDVNGNVITPGSQ